MLIVGLGSGPSFRKHTHRWLWVPAFAGTTRSTESFRRPRIQTTRNRRLIAPALRRNVQPDDVGIADQFRKIRPLKKPLRVCMNRIKRFLRQRVAQFAGAAGKRRERWRGVDRGASGGNA